jgi:hypothetical protein
MNIKSRSLSGVVAIFAACALLTGSGCHTTGTGATQTAHLTPQQAARGLKAVTRGTTALALQSKPELRPDFAIASQGLSALINRGQFDSQSLREAFAQINVEVNDGVWTAIESVIELFDSYTGDFVAQGLDRNAYVRPLLEGVQTGLVEGLAAIKATP